MLPNEKNTVALDCEFVTTGHELDTLGLYSRFVLKVCTLGVYSGFVL